MSREAFEAWYDRYHTEACEQYGGIDCTNPKGVAEEAWQAARADAFERAAKTCNRLSVALDNAGNMYLREATASQCAGAIRALAKELGNRKTICARIMSDGKPCGLRGPCPDCGLSLNDFGPDEETGTGK